MQCGLIGLPNVGKSTIFRALSLAPAEIANYPFCTIEPNVGIAAVPDERLTRIGALCQSAKIVPTTIKFVDIAGLVAGASAGEGLGNRFLSHIRECNVICHVVRCFDTDEIAHVAGKVSPRTDFGVIATELILADMEVMERRTERNNKIARGNDAKKAARARQENAWLEEITGALGAGETPTPIPRYEALGEGCAEIADELNLLTAKQQIIICNIDENSIGAPKPNSHVDAVKEMLGGRLPTVPIVEVCGKLEAELSEIEDPTERDMFIKECGIAESGLIKLIHSAYRALGLCTFFTAGKNEARAWTFTCGSTVAEAAGKIHTDFQSGFIKAEVYHYQELIQHGTETALRQAGRMRVEGREYIAHDGDVIFIHAH